MTSSSDSEVFRRQIAVCDLPENVSNESLRLLFQSFGAISSIHRAKAQPGIAFLTFEDEQSARNAIAQVKSIQGTPIKVSIAVNSSVMQWFPVTGHKRQVQFPRAFLRGSRHHSQSMNPHSSFKQYLKSPQSGIGGKSASAKTRVDAKSRDYRCSTHVQVFHTARDPREPQAELLQPDALMSFNFPHVFANIMSRLDSVSLLRCRLVCKSWAYYIQRVILDSPEAKERLKRTWRAVESPILALDPGNLPGMPKNMLAYRNVTCLQVDELEIFLGLDNGNVEVYDRYDDRLKSILTGKFSLKPKSIHINAHLIVIVYVPGIGLSKNVILWQVFERTSKGFLASLERNPGQDALILGLDNKLYSMARSRISVVDLDLYVGCHGKHDEVEVFIDLAESCSFEAMDIDRGHEVVAGIVRQASEHLALMLWNLDEPQAHSVLEMSVLEDLTDPRMAKTSCLSIELRYPIALCVFSNTDGNFDHFQAKGPPFVLVKLYDLGTQTCLRTINVDHHWIKLKFLFRDEDSGVIGVRFDNDHLVMGFQTAISENEGFMIMWDMEDILDASLPTADLEYVSFPTPQYHQLPLEGHAAGIRLIHVDKFQLLAITSCSHQITTSCLGREDRTVPDNVWLFDFWAPNPLINWNT